jgi:hypothetical protein
MAVFVMIQESPHRVYIAPFIVSAVYCSRRLLFAPFIVRAVYCLRRLLFAPFIVRAPNS